MRECRRDATKATTGRRARHDPGFPRSFPAYCYPLRICLRVPSSRLASASRRIYAFIRAKRRPHPRMTPEGMEEYEARGGSGHGGGGEGGRGSPPSIIVAGV